MTPPADPLLPGRTDEEQPREERRTAQSAGRLWMGVGYLSLCFAVLLNAGLHHKGLPSIALGTGTRRAPLGSYGPAITGGLGVIVLGFALLAGGLTRRQWLLTALTAVWLLAPWLALGVSEGTWDLSLWGIGATGMGVAVAAGLAGALAVRWTLYGVGVVWSSASLIVGGLALRSPDPGQGLVRDPFDRFSAWLRLLGLDAADGSARALVGVGLHRNLLGMTLALLLVLQMRHVLTLRVSVPVRTVLLVLGPVLTAIPLLWSMSRTSIAAAATGALAGLLPVERLRGSAPKLVVSVIPAALVVAPLLARDAIAANLDPGTMRWRALLWQQTLELPGLWSVLGVRPVERLALDATHAHNQALEALVRGGLLGALALALAAVIGTYTSIVVAGSDRRATFAVIVTAAVVATSEIVGSAPSWSELSAAATILVALTTSAAGLVGARSRDRGDAGAA